MDFNSDLEKVSVLMVIHRSDDPDHLKTCLSSLIEQSLTPDEIMIVSDGLPSKNQLSVVESHEFEGLVVKIYRGNKKFVGALNLGLRNVRNNIVARMDPDDICHVDRLRVQLSEMVRLKSTAIGAQVAEFDHDHTQRLTTRRVVFEPSVPAIYFRNPMNHMSVMFDKNKILAAGGYQYVEGFEDWHLWLRLFKNKEQLNNVDKTLVFARVGNGFNHRRFGRKYVTNEIRALKRFHREGLINTHALLLGLPLRVLFRLAFHPLRSLGYKLIRSL